MIEQLGEYLAPSHGQPTTVWEHIKRNACSVLCPGTDGLVMQGELSSVNEGIHLTLPEIDANWFIMQAPMVFAHPHESCLILLIISTNTLGTLWSSWNLASSCCMRKTLVEEVLKSALRHPFPGWQGV